ncbi:hypothetical protein C3B44_00950 [Corynebacterium yudongzhengii]|uniref:Alpha/beta hydrolase n=2 Tax=Corynebacterium yudongzhengii TaxID=2080740 RepID=A0A2U1T5I0_9CORY|nr:hypothetical protein C3B44_00950 [Corynebacterium yudongzhengii]PWC01251.1 alpha/beta hydrolase [Corynebacterium yudongzhengii]
MRITLKLLACTQPSNSDTEGGSASMAGAEPFEAQRLNYKDQQITYFDRGAAQEGRRPVLLIHGTSGTAQGHYGQIFPMLATNTRVIASDWAFPGADSLELDELVDQQLAVLDATVGEEKVDVIGFSLGAVVAQALAARYPERVGALILVCGWASTDNHQKLRNGLWRTLYQEDSAALKEFMALCAFSPGFVRRQDPEVIEPASRPSRSTSSCASRWSSTPGSIPLKKPAPLPPPP